MTGKSGPIKGKIAADHPLAALIEEAYEVFACPPPKETGVCVDCCMAPEIEADFFGPPIRDLPLLYLQDWYTAAHAREGVPQSVWRYLLPRILEVLAAGEDPCALGREVVLVRFPTGEAAHWHPAEWSVLDRFRRAFLAREIAAPDPGSYLDDTICMFGRAAWPLEDLLSQVMDAPDDLLAARLWRDWCNCAFPSVWITAFWDRPERDRMLAFYTSRALCTRMEAFALADDTMPALAEQAIDLSGVIRGQAGWHGPAS